MPLLSDEEVFGSPIARMPQLYSDEELFGPQQGGGVLSQIGAGFKEARAGMLTKDAMDAVNMARVLGGERAKVGAAATATDQLTRANQLLDDAGDVPYSGATHKLLNANSFGEAWNAFTESPFTVVKELGARSATASAVSLAPAIAAGAVAGPAGFAVGSGAGSGGMEYISSIRDGLQREGIDVDDPNAMIKAASDPELMARVKDYAQTRGGIIGAIDAATGGLATKTFAPKALTSPASREAANLVTQTGIQMAGGAGGEAAAQLATGQELQPGQIAAEAAGELIGAPIDIAGAAVAGVRERAAGANSRPDTPLTLPAPAPYSVSADGIVDTGVQPAREQGDPDIARQQHPAYPREVAPAAPLALPSLGQQPYLVDTDGEVYLNPSQQMLGEQERTAQQQSQAEQSQEIEFDQVRRQHPAFPNDNPPRTLADLSNIDLLDMSGGFDAQQQAEQAARAARRPAEVAALVDQMAPVDMSGDSENQPVSARQTTEQPVEAVEPVAFPAPTRAASEGTAPVPESDIESRANEAATSPTNERPLPTLAQIEAGNYAKGHIRLHGLDIAIENPRGSERSGRRPDGSTWSHTMSDHYGYIKRTVGSDGEQVDVYVGPNTDSEKVYVVDQLNQADGKFDEHKVLMGFKNRVSAVNAYKSNFDKGWKVGKISPMSIPEFKEWLKGDTSGPLQQIDDFGEKIGGARKDVWSGFRQAFSEDLPADAAEISVAKNFPEPNYRELANQGVATETLALIKAIRDSIPSKPRVAYKVRRWVEQFKALRGFVNELLDGTHQPEVLAKLLEDAPRDVKTLVRLGFPHKVDGLRGARVRSGTLSYANGVSYNPPLRKFWVEQPVGSSRSATRNISGKYFDTEDEAMDFLASVLAEKPQKMERKTRLDVYHVTATGDIVIGKKVSPTKHIDIKGGFKSGREARNYLAQNETELLAELERKKHVPSERRSVNDPRKGEDYRKGSSISPPAFADKFGFRGVEFGNWVEQDRRQRDLNDAFDALRDLAKTVGIPLRAVSLNGELGLAFGARGKGGKRAAAAHYEPDRVVINLTKSNGEGSLGHEWWHALDNYFSRMGGRRSGMLTENARSLKEDSVRPEVIQAFSGVIEAIKRTDLPSRSKQLDSTRSKDYWSTPAEITARAFERYLIDKASARSESNDYLANIIMPSSAAIEPDSYPYPLDAEMTEIGPAFDLFFAALKSRETSAGVQLYRVEDSDKLSPGAAPKGMPVKQTELIAREFFQRFPGAADVTVRIFRTGVEVFGPTAADAGGRGVKARFDPGSNTVVLIASAHNDAADVRATLQHEILVHKGLGLFPQEAIDRLISNIQTAAANDSEIAKLWNEVNRSSSDRSDTVKAEEVLARAAEQRLTLAGKWWNRIVSAIRSMLRRAGWISDNLSVAELRDLIYRIGDAFREGRQAAPRDVDETMYRHDDEAGRASPESEEADRAALEKIGLAPRAANQLSGRIRRLISSDLRAVLKELGARANEGMFDGLAGIRQAEDAAGVGVAAGDYGRSGYVGARIATGNADVMSAVLHYGAPEWRDGVIQYRPGTRGLLEVLGDIGPDLDAWLSWMAGNRGRELMAQGRENNLTQADVDILVGKARGKEAKFEKARQEYLAINRAMLDLAEQSGMIDPQARKLWESDWYIPFYRTGDADQDSPLLAPRTKRGLSHQTAGIKALKGGETATNDLLENILTNWIKLADSSLKNMALLKTVDNLKGTDFIKDETMKFKSVLVSRSQIIERIRADREYLQAVADALGMLDAGELDLVSEIAKLDQKGFDTLWTMVAPTDPDVIRVQRGGKSEYFRVLDPALLRAVAHVNFAGFHDPITRTGRWFKRLLTAGVTAAPDFIARNFVRDAVHAWAINKDGFSLAKSSLAGLSAALKEDADYRRLMFAGASFQGGYVHGTDPEASAQIVRRALEKKGLTPQQIDAHTSTVLDTPAKLGHALRRGWERYREIGDKVENANRLATFKAAIAAGKPLAQAVYEAKDLMDYSMRGNFIALQWFTDMVPFLNARLIGLQKLGRAVAEDPKVVAIKLAQVAAFSLALAMLNDDDDRYKELPDWEKDAYWHFWIGAQHWRIPKPFEIGVLAGTIPERFYRAWVSKTQPNEKLLWSLKHNFWETLSFNPVPQFVLPMLETWGNRNWYFDKPIESQADQKKVPEARYDSRTSETMRKLGEWTGTSPKMLEHLWGGYTGTMGGYALSLVDRITRVADDAPPRPSMQASDISALGSFWRGSSPSRGTSWETDFWDRKQEVDEIWQTVRALRKEGEGERADRYIAENRGKLRYRKALDHASEQLSGVKKRMERIANDPHMAPGEKRLKLDELQRRRNELARKAAEQTEAAF